MKNKNYEFFIQQFIYVFKNILYFEKRKMIFYITLTEELEIYENEKKTILFQIQQFKIKK